MITRRKVLVLGAGASVPFGFPSGWQLRNDICRGLQGSEPLRRVLESELGFPNEHLNNFRQALEASRQPSVDRFLEFRPEFLDVGKAAIAGALIPYESPGRFDRPEQTWYDHLLAAVMCPRDQFHSNCLSIVTYNYDRSLEYFLLRSISHAYGIDEGAAVALLANIPIVHLHGSLGDLEARAYWPDLTAEAVRRSAGELRVVHEEITEPYERALELINRAEMVCVLGFGYNDTNMKRLRMGRWPHEIAAYGTAYGMTAAEKTSINGHLMNNRPFNFGLGNQDVLAFLRHHALLP